MIRAGDERALQHYAAGLVPRKNIEPQDADSTTSRSYLGDEDSEVSPRSVNSMSAAQEPGDVQPVAGNLVLHNSLSPAAQAVDDDLDSVFKDIKLKIDTFEDYAGACLVVIARLFRCAEQLYIDKYGSRTGRPRKSVESIPTFSRMMAEKVGRSESYIYKFLALTRLDEGSRLLIEDRPALAADFSATYALAKQADPSKRAEAISAFDRGGRRGLMATLKAARGKRPVCAEATSENEPNDPRTNANVSVPDAGIASEPTPAEQISSAPTGEAEVVVNEVASQAAAIEQAVRALATDYTALLATVPHVVPSRVRVLVAEVIVAINANSPDGNFEVHLARVINALVDEDAGNIALDELLASVPKDRKGELFAKAISGYRAAARPVTTKWVGERAAYVPVPKSDGKKAKSAK